MDYAPTADFGLVRRAYDVAQSRGFALQCGSILTADLFYDRPRFWDIWTEHGVLAVEMESAGLYTVAAKHKARAMTLLTVSDILETGEAMSGQDRERSLDRMIKLALETAVTASGTDRV